ncbi:EamA family transporter [Microbispora sp. RL4-1S]|uniref:EamA family transporter n=1 Tax=Microbispora oryzae TaxID=2806554 RepID=A0A940WMQ3_9ACTN|nr:EamA family transporter [Microbispora oryzae]MBP2708485.1 EamA family transporter [Microbispora oryzae]
MERNGHDIRVWTALATVYVVWGSTYLGIKVAVETLPPLIGAGLRFVAAAALLGVILLLRRGTEPFRVTAREFGGAALVGLLMLAGGNGFVGVAEEQISSGLAALLVASVPLWLVVFRTVVRDRPRAATLAGVLVGFVGVAGLTLRGGVSGQAGGIATLLAASVSWTLGSFLSPRIPMPRNPFAASTIEMAVGGVGLLLLGDVTGEHLRLAAVSGRSWTALAYLILVGSLIGFTSYVWLLGHAPISLVSTYAYVNPIVAVVLGMIVLSEPLTGSMLAGGALIVAGVALVVSTERRRGAPPSPAPENDQDRTEGREPARAEPDRH